MYIDILARRLRERASKRKRKRERKKKVWKEWS